MYSKNVKQYMPLIIRALFTISAILIVIFIFSDASNTIRASLVLFLPSGNTLPSFRNPPMHHLDRLYTNTDDIYKLKGDNLENEHESTKYYGWDRECEDEVVCGSREAARRQKESMKAALANFVDYSAARRRIYIDLGGRSFTSSVSYFLRNYPISFDAVHVFEAEKAYETQYLNKNKISFHNAVVTDFDGNAEFDENGCTWRKIVKRKKNSRHILQVPNESTVYYAIDFSRWLKEEVSTNDFVVVKMDIEGEEYKVLKKLISDGTIRLISELFVEVHNLRFNHHPCIGAGKTPLDSYKLLRKLRRIGVYVHQWY